MSILFSFSCLCVIIHVISFVNSSQKQCSGQICRTLAIVYSYHDEFYHEVLQHEGISQGLAEEGLFEGVNLDTHRYYMKSLIEPENIAQVALEIIDEISALTTKPDLLLLVDDFALDFVGLPLRHEYPLIFSGISTDLEILNAKYNLFETRKTPGKNFTGVMENVFVFETIRLLTVVVPSITNHGFLLLFDNSSFSANLYYHNEKNSYISKCKSDLNVTLEIKTINTIQELDEEIERAINDPFIRGFGHEMWSLKDELSSQIIVSDDINPYIVEKIKYSLPTGAFDLQQSISGLLGGLAADTTMMGEVCGHYVGKVLNQDVLVGDLSIVDSPSACCWYKNRFYDLGIDPDGEIYEFASYVFEDDPSSTTPTKTIRDNNYWLLSFLALILVPLPPLILLTCCLCFFILLCVIGVVSFLLCVSICSVVVFAQRRKLGVTAEQLNEILAMDGGEVYVRLKEKQLLEKTGQFDPEDRPKLNINEELLIKPTEIELQVRIGSGGSNSSVWKSSWKGRIVAFKRFQAVTLNGQYDFEEFEKETKIISSISHPNICRFFGVCIGGERFNRLGVVMEFCENSDLANYIRRMDQNNEKILFSSKMRMLLEICAGMYYLNERKIIHRDLKCENVLLDKDKTCKIVDFGISRSMKNQTRAIAKTKRVGTSIYMAPEILVGNYSYSCDIFSFSILMYILLTENMKPYGDLQDGLELKVAINPYFRPRFTKELNKKIPSWLRDLMTQNWDDDPTRRCEDFEEIIQTINTHMSTPEYDVFIRMIEDEEKKEEEEEEEIEIKENEKEEEEENLRMLSDPSITGLKIFIKRLEEDDSTAMMVRLKKRTLSGLKDLIANSKLRLEDEDIVKMYLGPIKRPILMMTEICRDIDVSRLRMDSLVQIKFHKKTNTL